MEESGIAFLEKQLDLRDIYEDQTLNILEKAEAVLQAEFLLHPPRLIWSMTEPNSLTSDAA